MLMADCVRSFIMRNFTFSSEEILDDDLDLFQAGIIDSTGVLDLVAFLESPSGWGLTIPDSDLLPGNFSSIRNICAYITRRYSDVAA